MMEFDKIIGQLRVKEILRHGFHHNRLSHAFLFYGPDGVGKEAMALELARALLCKNPENAPCGTCGHCHRVSQLIHSDLIYLFPSMKNAKPEDERTVMASVVENPYVRLRLWASPSISIDKIRNLRKVCSTRPLEGRGRVVIIAEADKMTVEASNALLKILEEPAEKMTLILTAPGRRSLLPTIISRCQQVKFTYLSDLEIEKALITNQLVEKNQARLLSRLAFGSIRRVFEWKSREFGINRARVVDVLRDCLVKSDLSLLTLVDELVKEGDKNSTRNLLRLILIWLRDVMIIKEISQVSEKYLVNLDQVETLKKFSAAFSHIDFDAAIKEIDAAIENIDRNIQLNLVLVVLFYRLRRFFVRSQ